MSSLRLTISMRSGGSFCHRSVNLPSVLAAIGPDQFEPREAPAYLVEDEPGPSRSWIAAEWTTTRLGSPSLSTRAWIMRPFDEASDLADEIIQADDALAQQRADLGALSVLTSQDRRLNGRAGTFPAKISRALSAPDRQLTGTIRLASEAGWSARFAELQRDPDFGLVPDTAAETTA